MTDPTHRPATEHDILAVGIWTNAFAKILIEKGVLKKADVIAELKRVQPSVTRELHVEIDSMIERIDGWLVRRKI
jgi:hypothetical protein